MTAPSPTAGQPASAHPADGTLETGGSFIRYDDAATMAGAVAAAMAADLAAALTRRPAASLVVSGGRTPERLFGLLAKADLDWARVTITLADERWVAADHPDSNAALVRRTLLTGPAAAARFVGLYDGSDSPEAGEDAAAAALAAVPRPFDLVLLGMGDDGHTASLFPGGNTLAAALDPQGTRPCRAIRAPGAAQPRITLTLPALLDSRRIILLLAGAGKQHTLDRATAEGPAAEMPVRAVLRQSRVPIDIRWAP